MFLSQYKKQNENIFKANIIETKCNLAETYYNMIENGHNSTENNSSAYKEKITQSVLIYKENTKKSVSDISDFKTKRNIKLNGLNINRNHKDKFVDIYSSNKINIFTFQ